MIRKVCITLFSLFATVGVFVAFGQSPVQQDENGRASVDFRADQMSRIKVGDSSALCLVGHVVFFHKISDLEIFEQKLFVLKQFFCAYKIAHVTQDFSVAVRDIVHKICLCGEF